MQYLPLNNLTFLNVLCFVNKLQNDFKSIKYTAFMYNEHLVWTSFEPNKFQPVYQYMIGTLLPAQLETELQGGSMPRHHMFSGSSSQSQRYCRFVTGPTTLSEGASYMGKVPKIHLNLTANPDETEEFFLVVYRGFSSSVLMFMDVSTDLNMELYQKLDEFMEPALTALGSEIAEYCSTQPLSSHVATNVSESGSRFVYFNKLNLAYKSTVHLDNRQLGNINVSHEALKLIADLNADQMSQRFYGEIIAKTMSNYWVVGKFSNQREFYVAINNNKNLIEINDEVKKLCDAELKGIFFQT